MDNTSRLIRYLYDEAEYPEEIERLLAADGTLREEYRQMKATKRHLDKRPRQRPDAAVVDRIVAAAGRKASTHLPADAHPPAEARADRPPVARSQRSRSRVLGATSVLAAVLIAVSVGVWQWDGRVPGAAATETVVDAQSVAAESSHEAATPAAEESALPAWDEANDDLVRLHHYIETLHGRSSPERWDAPDAGFQPASQVRPAGR